MEQTMFSNRILVAILVAAILSPALAPAGGRFVPLGNQTDQVRRAENVTRDANGDPIVAGAMHHAVFGFGEAATFRIGMDDSVSAQPLPGGPLTFSARTALYVPRGAQIAVGRATSGPLSQALLWLGFASDPILLGSPNDPNLPNRDCEGGKYEEVRFRGADLVIAVGVCYSLDFTTLVPTLWSSENGFAAQRLARLPGGPRNGAARAIVRHNDQTIIAGTAVGAAGASEGVIWNGTALQTVLPRGSLLAANAAALSRDTRFVAGLGVSSGFATVPVAWSDLDGDGVYELHTPALPAGISNGIFNAIRSVENTRGDAPSAIAVGSGFGGETAALIFDPENGIRRLADVLTNDYGLDLQGFTLEDATDLSVGGNTLRICGNGVNAQGQQEGWYAEVPLGAAPCVGDLDGDGVIGLGDLAILLANFGTPGGATPEMGDLDGDGDVDLTDLAVVLSIFGTPCA